MAFDFRPLYSAACAVLRGDSPYPALDDPLTASSAPTSIRHYRRSARSRRALPLEAAGLVLMALLAATALAIPFVLGVRDWRCYGLVFLWPPVLSAIQTGNVTLFLGLAAALAWRFRDRAPASAACIGLTLAAKFFLWPLVVWLAATAESCPARWPARSPLECCSSPGQLSALRASSITSICDGSKTRSAPTRTRRTSLRSTSACPRRWRARSGSLLGRTSAVVSVGRRGDEQRVHPCDRGCTCAHSNRVAALLRLVGCCGLGRGAQTGDCLVHPAGDGCHAREWTSVAVRDFCNARSPAVTIALALRASVADVGQVRSDPTPAYSRAPAQAA